MIQVLFCDLTVREFTLLIFILQVIVFAAVKFVITPEALRILQKDPDVLQENRRIELRVTDK